MSSPQPPTYYRSRRGGAPPALARPGVTLLVVAVVVVAAVLLLSSAPGPASTCPGPARQAGRRPPQTGASADGSLRIVGAEKLWHNGPVTLRFRDADGKPVEASYRIDGGAWEQGKRVHVRGPEDHSADGMHTVEARPLDSSAAAASVKVGIDTTPPEVTAVRLAGPHRRDRHGQALVHRARRRRRHRRLGRRRRARQARGGARRARRPSGPASASWTIPKVDGETLGPGTYWLRVRAADRAGNVTEERASLACVHPVKARIITTLPKAGKEVALTFDGGSGYAWRSLMNELYSHDQAGTWFCTGVSVDKYPDMAQLAVEQRQTIGNHSYDHPDFSTISYQEQFDQLKRNSDAWWKACKAVPQPFFRPPYGSQTATTVKAAGDAGYRYVVMWNGDAGDWRGLPASQVAANALAAAKPGAIIVFHTQWNSDAALPAVLKGLKAKGLKAVSLAQLCAGRPY